MAVGLDHDFPRNISPRDDTIEWELGRSRMAPASPAPDVEYTRLSRLPG